MVRFTFASGYTKDFDYDWLKVAPKLLQGGLRLYAPYKGVLIPLNSATIAIVEDLSVAEPEEEIDIEIDFGDEADAEEEIEAEVAHEEEKMEENPKSIEEKKEELLAEMKRKSECKHEAHDIYFQSMKTGPIGNQKMTRRYFPVCKECEVRERYVKADTLSDEQKANAIEWTK